MVKDDILCLKEGCNNKAEIKKLCKYHYWSEIKKLSSKVQNKKVKLRAVSKKGYEKSKLYKKARQEYLETHCCCEAKLTGCTIPTNSYDNTDLQIHHKKGRAGELLYNKDYFLAVCFNCHRYIEDNPYFAISNGFSLSRFAGEDDVVNNNE